MAKGWHGMQTLLISLLLLILTGCQYHYNLYVVAGKLPTPNGVSPSPNGVSAPGDKPQNMEESKSGAVFSGRAVDDTQSASVLPDETKSKSKPMSIAPGNFTATQTQGGNMINVTINLNVLKPTSVSTDANASLQGVPGF